MSIIGYKLTRKTISLGFGQSLREFKAYFYINGHLDCVMANLRCQLDISGKREPQLKKKCVSHTGFIGPSVGHFLDC